MCRVSMNPGTLHRPIDLGRLTTLNSFDAVKEQIRTSVDLVDVVADHVQLKRAGRELRGLCPFHSEKTPSFYVNPDKGVFRCHGCGAGGDIFKFVQALEGIDFPEAVRHLADRAGIDLRSTRERSDPSQPGKPELVRVNEWAARFFRTQLLDERRGAVARRYLDGRGFCDEVTATFQVGLAPDDPEALQRAARSSQFPASLLLAADLVRKSDHGGGFYDTFRNRLIFPIRDAAKRCVGFGGRTLGDAPAKYLNTAQNAVFDKSRTLFGMDVARPIIGERRLAVVVEGYTDCLAAHQLGVPYTVATLGTSATDGHMALLRRYCDDLVLLFDSDTAGEAAADRAVATALQNNLKVRIACLEEGKDPGDLLAGGTAAEFMGVLNSSVDALAFKWSRTRARYKGSESERGRREALEEFVGFVASASRYGGIDAIQRGLVVNQVAKLLALPPGEVQELLARTASSRGGRVSQKQVATGAGGGGPVRASEDAGQAAARAVLEVLLNAPALYAVADGIFDVDRLEDPLLRKVGQRVWEAARCYAPGDRSILGALLSSTEDEAEARLLMELSHAGEHIGNWEETLHCALERIEQANAGREHQSRAESLIRLDRDTDDAENEAYRQPLEAIARGLNAMTTNAAGHCIPPKLRRRRDAAASLAETLLEAGE